MPARPTFEHEVCNRCKGSGKFSFNQMHGSKCYGCGGSGYTLTKRGKAAQAFVDAMRVVPAAEIKVGDLIYWDMFTFRCWAKVESIEQDGERFSLRGTRDKTGERIGQGCVAKSMIRRGFSGQEKGLQITKALAFQASLTKTGTISKRLVPKQSPPPAKSQI